MPLIDTLRDIGHALHRAGAGLYDAGVATARFARDVGVNTHHGLQRYGYKNAALTATTLGLVYFIYDADLIHTSGFKYRGTMPSRMLSGLCRTVGLVDYDYSERKKDKKTIFELELDGNFGKLKVSGEGCSLEEYLKTHNDDDALKADWARECDVSITSIYFAPEDGSAVKYSGNQISKGSTDAYATDLAAKLMTIVVGTQVVIGEEILAQRQDALGSLDNLNSMISQSAQDQ